VNSQATAGFTPGRLRVFPADRPVLELWLTEPRRYRIGRDADGDICLDDPGISREHLVIDASQSPWQALDPGSKNGSRIDGRPLDRAELSASCWLSLAGVPARFEYLSADALNRHDQQTTQKHDTVKLLLTRLEQQSGIDEVMNGLLNGFLELAGCTRGALLLTTDRRHFRVFRLSGWARFEGSRSLVDTTLSTGRPTAVNDLDLDQALMARESIARRRLGALVCLPLTVQDEVRGALYAESDQAGKFFTELDVELMQAMADQAMLLISLEDLRGEIRALS
jgi:GAF domain-containing protein